MAFPTSLSWSLSEDKGNTSYILDNEEGGVLGRYETHGGIANLKFATLVILQTTSVLYM